MLLSMLLVVGATVDVNAQGWLKKLGKTAEKAAKMQWNAVLNVMSIARLKKQSIMCLMVM